MSGPPGPGCKGFPVTWLQALFVVAAGVGAGTVNTIVGSGSLITFPTLLAVGLPGVAANVSNNIGLVPGVATGVYGYRRELVGQGRRARTLGAASALGGLTGAVLLLVLPAGVFNEVVPVLILVGVALMAVQPALSKRVAARKADEGGGRDVGPVPLAIGFFTGIYGGYFGAAQGVILLGMLAVFVPDNLQRSNALKNVLAGTVNGVAAIVFLVFAFGKINWLAVVLVAVGAIVGGALGSRYGRRIPPHVLRVLVIVLGTGVAIKLFLS